MGRRGGVDIPGLARDYKGYYGNEKGPQQYLHLLRILALQGWRDYSVSSTHLDRISSVTLVIQFPRNLKGYRRAPLTL